VAEEIAPNTIEEVVNIEEVVQSDHLSAEVTDR
jgi:hypothetical protein